ncbi:MAG: hypothetical protein AVDCRST_MAG67-1914, partial [uncultured Solirubrobacteraceae bacterium]
GDAAGTPEPRSRGAHRGRARRRVRARRAAPGLAPRPRRPPRAHAAVAALLRHHPGPAGLDPRPRRRVDGGDARRRGARGRPVSHARARAAHAGGDRGGPRRGRRPLRDDGAGGCARARGGARAGRLSAARGAPRGAAPAAGRRRRPQRLRRPLDPGQALVEQGRPRRADRPRPARLRRGRPRPLERDAGPRRAGRRGLPGLRRSDVRLSGEPRGRQAGDVRAAPGRRGGRQHRAAAACTGVKPRRLARRRQGGHARQQGAGAVLRAATAAPRRGDAGAQRALPVRQRQEVQALPRRL